jgi:hypothetical protein
MEILLRAEESSDLGEAPDGGLGDVDVLRAAGMAGQEHDLALQLWRLTILGERRTLAGVVLMLMDIARKRGIEHPEEAVCSVVEWMMDPTCHPCKGRGLLPVDGVEHVLSDDVCTVCGGSGHRPTGFSDGAKTLYSRVQDMQSYAAGAIARKLRG